ncbi:MAG: hypothetical protein JW779_13735 [Candidatus Thorarchaeota archaeon]|nr:hypothetical protein [Candidatus Thorarchaeota archaeon]
MATCSLCGKEDLTFTCPYCNGVYCGEHRLPESHGCPGIQKVREDAKRKVSSSLGMDDDYDVEENRTWSPIMPKKKKKHRTSSRSRFSRMEIRDLLISVILVALVGISILGSPFGIVNALILFYSFITGPDWWFPVGMISIFILSFIGHELAHKFTAQHYGMWSEFRMTTMGYYLSAIAILFSIPIFGTGTVYTSGTSNRDHNAKANLAGPLSNFIIASGLVIGAIISVLFLANLTRLYVLLLIKYGIIINSVLGLFNMIPFQPFDGATVKDWSKPVWIILTIALVSMLLVGYLVIPTL